MNPLNPIATPDAVKPPGLGKYLPLGVVGLVAWWSVYRNLALFAEWFTYWLCGFTRGTRVGATIESPRNERAGFFLEGVKRPAMCWLRSWAS